MEIRRPLYYISIAFAAAILVRQYFGIGAAVLMVAGLVIVWRMSRGRQCPRRGSPGNGPKQILPLLILLSFSAGLASVLICDHHLAGDPALGSLEQSEVMVGVVKQPEYYRDSKEQRMVRIETELRMIGEKRVRPRASKVLVTAKLEDVPGSSLASVPPGSFIRFRGELEEPEGRRNPNCFDYRLYLKTKGIQATVRAGELEVDVRGTISGRLFLLRERYLERIEKNAGEETAGLIRAMLFGEKGELGDDVQELFQRNGTAHILAVSGLHVGMLYGAACLLWDLLAGIAPGAFGARRGKRFFVTMAVLFIGYTFLAGYSPSVVRAVAMVLLHAFAKMTGRRYDLPCAAFAVGIIALAANPYILFQAGFQMSFLAVLTLGLITPYVHQVYSGALAGSIAIQLGLGPYMMYQFNILPLAAVMINVPVIFLAGILVPAGMLGMFLPGAAVAAGAAQAAAEPGAAAPGSVAAGIWDQGVASLCGTMIKLNELCSASRITAIDVASPPIWAMSLFYLGLLVFASEEGRRMILRRRKRMVRGLIICVVFFSVAFGQAADDGFRKADLVFVDVGQGDCMHLRIRNRVGFVRYNVLVDGGGKADYDMGKKTLKPYLLKNGARRIDLAVVTHLHTDHYDGIRSLARQGMVEKLCIYEGYQTQEKEILKECGLDRDDLIYVTAGDEIRLGETAFMFLAPPARTAQEYEQLAADEEDENKKSLLIKVVTRGVSAMMTGDIGEEGEREAMEAQTQFSLHCDILKVGHHGSKTSSCEEFLDAVGPAFAVIQVGRNNMYGHPTPEVLQRLEERGVRTYRNDLQGAVGMEVASGKIRRIITIRSPVSFTYR